MKIASLLLTLLPGLALAAPHDAEVAAVRALYARFAAEAVIDDTRTRGLADAPPAVLRQHFTEALSRLWLRDRDCVRRTREFCRIDFQPIWASQDAVGTTVTLHWDDGLKRVAATLGRVGGPTRVLAYSLTRERGSWRIADIDYGIGQPSLRQLLAAPTQR
ncbi:hypothetical protein [Roseateles sp. P5_E7]